MKAHGALLHLLRTPLVTTTDAERADSSRWVWTKIGHYVYPSIGTFEGEPDDHEPVYAITVLGVLHRLFGFTAQTVGHYERSA